MQNLEAAIREHTAALRSRHGAVSECRVSIEDRPAHRYERRRYNVRLDIALGDHAIVINREHEDDPAVALEDAFGAAHLQLETLQV